MQPRLQHPHLLKVEEFAQRASWVVRRLRANLEVIHANGYVLREPHHVNTAHFVHAAWLRSPVRRAELKPGMRATYQALYSLLNSRWERLAFGRAQFTVAVSSKVRQELLEAGIPAQRVGLIPNGVDLQEFHPGPGDRAALGFAGADPVALFVGGIRTAHKNLDTLLHALVRCRALRLAVVGRVEGSPFPAMARRLGLEGRVAFLGFRRDVAALMRAADLFVCPSRYETFALVVLEAMASGLPVITTRTVGAADLVSPANGVVLPDPNDASALAQVLARLAASAPLRIQMGLEARRVAESLGWARMASAYLALYEELSVRSPGGAGPAAVPAPGSRSARAQGA
ncbi:MAG: glycosyltransferase family 4 protein [Myxococcaceae bacterium]|nr:glycosyltransferase family 4 protein [Myxococcaceae bacterium]